MGSFQRLGCLDDYRRYGRQMIIEGLGLPGQAKLQNSSAVIVGAGGLGCPALQYLAAAGVGRLGIVDHDRVELSNLQRQVLHNEARVGTPKASSAATAIKELNSRVQVDVITEMLMPSNAVHLLSSYDIILDCTDNAPTRYLLSDTAVALGKPLVSGAAQKLEGQLCTYNFGNESPCYRCLFPKPHAPEMAGSCEETGILGAVTGIIGNLQALEAIKIITGLHDGKPSLLIFSALGTPPFRSIKLRSRRPTCPACGQDGQKLGKIEETDYVQFCGGQAPDWEARGMVESGSARIAAKELKEALDSRSGAVKVIDVRAPTEFGICHLPGSTNIPLNTFVANPTANVDAGSDRPSEVYFVCRLGNDSQIAAEALRGAMSDVVVKDVIGGLRAWSRDVDADFPVY